MRELPDWGKLVFPPRTGKGWAAVLPGAPPSAVQLMEGLMQYNPGEGAQLELCTTAVAAAAVLLAGRPGPCQNSIQRPKRDRLAVALGQTLCRWRLGGKAALALHQKRN